ncbi:type IV toxin-antitoxin system AbiEi family antitoxin domain-containing protein [Streptomyces sp. ME19-01-6]|uniref:type IV toxin-antitoxin system AbiEi family antitoxin domain-containing protein n=1 Tax=Streptomyces sp. ME19-01-6 TaxID=3028686 RepID=UPI0029BC2C69|nr:type IV toxin-antitoxin system AbiEi family antitoxin domain-containing protein [Streptomyces sp. ME19-01-6]MDX3231256.1 type IV toxin-antitoxin system AbiEi family antitoxin domain-containing protein [Streptomyces sp. ME19-01-6]
MTRTGDAVSLTGLAGAQGGVVMTAQALADGWDRRQLNRCLLREGWTRIGRGVWAEPGRAVDGMALLWANQLAHPQLVVSHTAAAVLHDIETRTERVEFIGPRGYTPTVRGGVLHQMPLRTGEITTVAGLRATTVARTMADLLRAGPRHEALVAVESAVSRRPSRGPEPAGRRGPRTRVGEIARALESGVGLQGARAAREWLAMVDPKAGSPAETIARLRMNDGGLYPESQALLITPAGRRVFPDFLFRGQGLAVEIEGYRWHGSREQHQRDTARFNEVLACPEVRRLLRFTASDVYQRPGKVIGDIRGALAQLSGDQPDA